MEIEVKEDLIPTPEIEDTENKDTENRDTPEGHLSDTISLEIIEGMPEPSENVSPPAYEAKPEKKKRGRKSKIALITEHEQFGKECAVAFCTVNIPLFGKDAIAKDEELTALQSGFSDMSKELGLKKMPWYAGLSLALGSYYITRITKEEHMTKAQKVGVWVKERYIKWRTR